MLRCSYCIYPCAHIRENKKDQKGEKESVGRVRKWFVVVRLPEDQPSVQRTSILQYILSFGLTDGWLVVKSERGSRDGSGGMRASVRACTCYVGGTIGE